MARLGFTFKINDDLQLQFAQMGNVDATRHPSGSSYVSSSSCSSTIFLSPSKFFKKYLDLYQKNGQEFLELETITDFYKHLEQSEIKNFQISKFEEVGLLSQLQAKIRGAIVRQKYQARLKILNSKLAKTAVSIIEDWWKVVLLTRRGNHFWDNIDKILVLQRAWKKKIWELRKRELNEFDFEAKKIQAWYRGQVKFRAYQDVKRAATAPDHNPPRISSLQVFQNLSTEFIKNEINLPKNIQNLKLILKDKVHELSIKENHLADLEKFIGSVIQKENMNQDGYWSGFRKVCISIKKCVFR